MVFQPKARKTWQDAKKRAGDALKDMKFNDGYGPMLDDYEKMDAKMKKAYDELEVLQPERST